jgi:hypothetical protein
MNDDGIEKQFYLDQEWDTERTVVTEFRQGDLIGDAPRPVGEIIESRPSNQEKPLWHLSWRTFDDGEVTEWDGARTAYDRRWRKAQFVIHEEDELLDSTQA